MKIVNIRVYQVELPNRTIRFKTRDQDYDIEATAEFLDSIITTLQLRKRWAIERPEKIHLTIDLEPFHNFELLRDSNFCPVRCFPLSEEQRLDFWNKFRLI